MIERKLLGFKKGTFNERAYCKIFISEFFSDQELRAGACGVKVLSYSLPQHLCNLVDKSKIGCKIDLDLTTRDVLDNGKIYTVASVQGISFI